MTLDQLRIFVAVAEHGHVTRAAADLGVTQSAVSASIAALEARNNTKLFDRVGRGIALTDIGRRFLPEARGVLDRAVAAKLVLEDLAGLGSGALSIAASKTIASYWLPRRLTMFHAAYPGIRLAVTIGNTRQVETSVVEGAADLGLVEGATQHPALVRRRLDRDRLVLVVAASQGDPGLKKGRLDLKALPWIIREEGSGTRAVLENLAAAEGLTLDELRVFLVLPDNEAVREAVGAGAGATIISENVVARDIAAGILRVVPIDLPERDFTLLRHSQRHASQAQLALIDQLLNGSRSVQAQKASTSPPHVGDIAHGEVQNPHPSVSQSIR